MAGQMIRREARVAFSLRAQPAWFRVAKWIVIIVAGRKLWGRPAFWRVFGAALAAALSLHAFYRHKTAGWTRAWGGWDDVATAGEG